MKKVLGTLAVVAGSVAVYEFLRRQGVIDQISGKVKETAGTLSEDHSLEAKGSVQKLRGHAKSFVEDVKDEAKDVAEDVKDYFEDLKD